MSMNEPVIGARYISKLRSVDSSDVDYYRYKYRDTEPQYDGSVVNVSFVSPILLTFEKYRFVLLENSKKIISKPQWKYRPDYVSYDQYGTVSWWQLIMWINDVKSIEYFDKDEIIVPSADILAQTIEAEAYSNNRYIDLNEDHMIQKVHVTLYRTPIDNIGHSQFTIDSSPTARELTKSELDGNETQNSYTTVFCRQVFTMDIPTLRLKYVDLDDVPEENTIRLIAKCKPNLIYNKHYTVMDTPTGERKRISWDPSVVQNSGLLLRLKENDVLEIQYVKKQ